MPGMKVEKLVREHLPLVGMIARRVLCHCYLQEYNADIRDLISSGGMALWEAAKEYDHRKGPFWNWAQLKIWYKMLDELREKYPLSRYNYDKLKTLRSAEYELACKLGRLPEEEEIAAALDMSPQELTELRQMEQAASMVALDRFDHRYEIQKASSRLIREALVDRRASPFEELSKKETIGILIECLGQLEAEQIRIIILKHYEEKTFKEIAEMLGEASAKVQTTYYRALGQLRKNMQRRLNF